MATETPKTGTRRGLVDRVVSEIQAAISARVYSPGAKLPSENVLAKEHGVSRPTIRAALNELKATGLVETRHGVGSFVVDKLPISVGIEQLDSITTSISKTGRKPGMEYISQTVRPLLPEEAASMEMSPETSAIELRRTILADAEVIAYSYDLIPTSIVPKHIENTKISGSLFEFMRTHVGLTPAIARAEIHAVHSKHVGWGPEADSHDLFVLLNQVHYDTDNRVFLYSKTYFIESRYTFTLIRTSSNL
ncbi:MAG: GntR family transcriptional regulator [Actinomycetaceae bacterium]|nr:GntR family transcriptional regulator [Actinomycetaceae bacterium]